MSWNLEDELNSEYMKLKITDSGHHSGYWKCATLSDTVVYQYVDVDLLMSLFKYNSMKIWSPFHILC